MSQLTFAEAEYEVKKRKTRREKFLERMDALLPWKKMERQLAKKYSAGRAGRSRALSPDHRRGIQKVTLRERIGYPFIPNLDEKRMRGIGFTTMAPGFYGHSGGCGTRLLVDPENHLVYAMTRMEGDDKFNQFNKEATHLLQELRK